MIIGIIRGAGKKNIENVVKTGFEAGLDKIEITLNSPDALELISLVSKKWPIGAGTVLNLAEAEKAAAAGAKFIVSPITDAETVDFCRKKNIPVYPSGLTPNEVYRAWQTGATMVKVFPIKCLGGPAYIKELKGPFNNIRLLACGGVTPQNIRDFFQAGAAAVAVGTSVFNKDWMDKGDFDSIRKKARELVEAV